MSVDLSLYFTPISYFSQKARLALEEKGVTYKDVFISLHTGETYKPWYMRINSRGQVPVLKHGEKYIPDSVKIAEYVDKNFDGPQLILDTSHPMGAEFTRLCQLMRDVAIDIITFGMMQRPHLTRESEVPLIMKMAMKSKGVSADDSYKHYTAMAEKYPDLRQAYLDKRDEIKARVASISNEAVLTRNLENVGLALAACEQRLLSNARTGSANDWLLGPNFTMADVELAIMLRRLKFVGAAHCTWQDGSYPQLEKYYQRLLNRRSFLKVCVYPLTTFSLNRYTMYLMSTKLKTPLIAMGVVTAGVLGFYYYKKYMK